jgi:ABC-2 type transport system permease protein
VWGTFVAGYKLQLRLIRADPDYLMPLAIVPFYTIVFLAIFRHAGRDDLTTYALLAPVLIALWQLSLVTSGETVADDRWLGTLELAVATPGSFAVAVVGRVLAVTSIALISFAEVWVVARVFFGVSIVFHHPFTFVLTLAATTLAMAGTALIMAALFVVTRSARTFQNSLSFPFYVLGGVLVPVSYLPDWLEPVATVVFLSWAADLLRDSLDPAPVDDLALRLAMVLALGAAGFLVGRILLARLLRHVRQTGEVSVA